MWPPQRLKQEQTSNKKPERVFDQGNGNGKAETKASSDAIDRPAMGTDQSRKVAAMERRLRHSVELCLH